MNSTSRLRFTAAALLLSFLATPIARADDTAPRDQRPRMPGNGTLLIVAGLGSAAMLSKVFEDPSEIAGALERSPAEHAIDIADVYGNGIAVGATAAGMMMWGRFAHNGRVRSMGDDLAESMLMAGGVVGVLKLSVGAKRPDGGDHSFPSGHTALAFSVAPVVAHHLGWHAGIAAYTVASVTGLARMEDRRHYLADVLFGAAIGIASGREVTRGNGLRAFVHHIRFSGNEFAVSFDF
jgi:membrane-associated phospholipid phosphatase